MKIRMPRWWHHIRADAGGYFWLPCPVCGVMFGGHEWDGRVWREWCDFPRGQSDTTGEGCCRRHPPLRQAIRVGDGRPRLAWPSGIRDKSMPRL